MNGESEEEVYMIQPEGFEHSDYPYYVCKLTEALYILKQVPRAWFMKLSKSLHDVAFQSSNFDFSMLIYNKHKDVIIFLVYVDDIIVTSNDSLFFN